MKGEEGTNGRRKKSGQVERTSKKRKELMGGGRNKEEKE